MAENKHQKLRHFVILFLTGFTVIMLFVVWCNYTISVSTEKYNSYDITNIPSCKTGLLLGTIKTLKNGYKNQYFYNRIDATVNLYMNSEISAIIVSGDNSLKEYNEPEDMRMELIARGIPDSIIYLDFAGFRTFDSVVRAKEIFGQNSFIIISQKFHNERAIYIARKLGIDAYGYNAPDVSAYMGFKTRAREVFARVKVYIDFLTGVEPKFLGEKVIIK